MSSVAYVDFKKPRTEGGRVADTDDGYTRLANELLEAVMSADLTARQLKIFMAIVRKTYGFGKKLDRITNTQIAEMTGIHHTHVCTAKNEMIAMNVLFNKGNSIGINKVISEWDFNISQVSETLAKPANKSLAKSANGYSPSQLNTKDTITKDKKDNNSTSENSDESSDKPPKNLPALRPDAAIQSAKGNKWGTSEDLKAAEFMYSKVISVMPAAKQPSWESWANDIRLMRNALNVDHQEICRVFKWANLDSFWQSNVMCPAKLREKWDTLNIQMAQWMKKRQQLVTQQAEPHWNSKESWEDVI